VAAGRAGTSCMSLEPGLTRDQLFDKLNGHTKGAAGLIGGSRRRERPIGIGYRPFTTSR